MPCFIVKNIQSSAVQSSLMRVISDLQTSVCAGSKLAHHHFTALDIVKHVYSARNVSSWFHLAIYIAAKSSSETPSYCPVKTPSLTSIRHVSPDFSTAKSTAQPARRSLLPAKTRTASSTICLSKASSPGDPLFFPYCGGSHTVAVQNQERQSVAQAPGTLRVCRR